MEFHPLYANPTRLRRPQRADCKSRRKDPLNRVTTTAYYAATDLAVPSKYTKGDAQTVTNAVGHITTFNEYDKNGRLTKLTDANGLITTMAYHPRGWLTSRAVNNGTTTETTAYTVSV